MSDTAAELVNLCTDETPRRPTKRIRPERLEPRVLSLVDSEDEAPPSKAQPRDQVGQVVERQPRMVTHWGALENQQVAPRTMGERPLYRPPSARFRRPTVLQQARNGMNPSPIVIDDDDDDEGNACTSPIFRNVPGPTRHNPAGAEPSSNGLALMLPPPTRSPPASGVSCLTFSGVGQAQQPQPQPQLQPQQPPLQWQRQGQEGAEDGRFRLQLQQQQQQQEQEHQQQLFGGRRPTLAVGSLRSLRRLPRSLPRGGPQVGPYVLQPQQEQGQQQSQQLLREGIAEDQEDADMRLAARLQAEEDERLARETAQRLEHEEHRRMMSRLDMLETLESASLAAQAALERRVLASERERASRRNDRLERSAAFDADEQAIDDLPSWRMMALPRSARGAALPGGRVAGGADAAEAAAIAAAEEAESMRAAAAAAAAAAAGARARWSSRSLNDVLPSVMALPFGLHRFLGGRPDAAEHAGSSRRGRHAAYREQAMAMREQLLAAQRAGIPAHMLLSDRDFTPEDYELLCRLDEQVENRKGAKDEQLAALPTEVVGAEGRRRSDGCPATCTICLEEVAPGDVLKRLSCLHDFHGECVDTWLKTKACCPICQRSV